MNDDAIKRMLTVHPSFHIYKQLGKELYRVTVDPDDTLIYTQIAGTHLMIQPCILM